MQPLPHPDDVTETFVGSLVSVKPSDLPCQDYHKNRIVQFIVDDGNGVMCRFDVNWSVDPSNSSSLADQMKAYVSKFVPSQTTYILALKKEKRQIMILDSSILHGCMTKYERTHIKSKEPKSYNSYKNAFYEIAEKIDQQIKDECDAAIQANNQKLAAVNKQTLTSEILKDSQLIAGISPDGLEGLDDT